MLLLVGESAEQKDQDIDGDGKEGDKVHDTFPAADAIGALSEVSTSIATNMLHLDHDLEQVGEEGKEGSEREGRREERNEAELDDTFVVEEDEGACSGLHLDLA